MKRTLWTALAAAITVSGCGYNTIQRMDEEVEESRANIETELIRRNDLIPNLVATVDEAAAFEERTFTRVAEARAGLERAREDVRQAVEGDADLPALGAASDDTSVLPDQLCDLLVRSDNLYRRIARLDDVLFADAPPAAPAVHAQQDALAQAFAN